MENSAPRSEEKAAAWQGLREFFALLLVVGAPAMVYAYVFGSPLFRLGTIRLHGDNVRVSRAWVETETNSFRDQNLLRLSRAAVEQRLMLNPWVDSVYIRKELPDRLHLTIREKRAVALVSEDGENFMFVGSDGSPITEVTGEGQLGMNLLKIYVPASLRSSRRGVTQSALKVRELMSQVAPELSAKIVFAESLGNDAFSLSFSHLNFRVIVAEDGGRTQIEGFRMILPELTKRYDNLESVDLRFGDEAVLRLVP